MAPAALKLTDFGRNRIIGGVGKPGIKIAVLLQVKQTSHLFAGCVLERDALINRQLSWPAVFRLPASLDTDCV